MAGDLFRLERNPAMSSYLPFSSHPPFDPTPVPTQEDYGPKSDVVETERQQRAAVQTKRHKKKKNFVPQNKPDVSPLIRNFISKVKP